MSNNSQTGIGFCSLLTILFIGLKLTEHIDWHWAWVLSPLWGMFGLLAAVFLVAFVVASIMSVFSMPGRIRKRKMDGRWR